VSKEEFLARSRSYAEIRQKGCIGSFNDGAEIELQGVRTRLVAWPGNGFLGGSVHVLTLRPGDSSTMYQYDVSEEVLVCLKGSGEVYVRDRWVTIAPGDIAYVPEGLPHGVRNPRGNTADFVLVSHLTPPSVDLYEPAGFFEREHQRMRLDEIQRAIAAATPGNLSLTNELQYREDHPELRPWNLTRREIRHGGALFNLFRGATFGGIGVPMRILVYPGFGARMANLHVGIIPAEGGADIHTHPISDDCIFVLEGGTEGHLGGDWVTIETYEAAMAPVGVAHGGRPTGSGTVGLVMGFGAPAELDVYLKSTDLFKDGHYSDVAFERLEWPPSGAVGDVHPPV
jgi:gentisate 1,2-dioxygenase